MEYIAHIKDDDASDGVNRIEETVTEHSEKVAKLAEKYGQPLRIPHIVCIGCYLTSRIRIFDTQNTKSE